METLLTIQAENLGAVVDPTVEAATIDIERLSTDVKRATRVFVCDSKPPTLQLLAQLAEPMASTEGLAIIVSEGAKTDAHLQKLKEKISRVGRPAESGGEETQYETSLLSPGSKMFIGTAEPDPLFGLWDSRVSACLDWIGNARRAATLAAREYEPSPFEKTESYKAVEEMAKRFPEASFVDVVPRGGKIRSVLQDAPFDAVRNGFLTASLSQARASVVGAGGAGYDDTLSGSLRSAWSSVGSAKSGGDLLIVGECADGLGSKALEMVASGRIDPARKAPTGYVEGIEEVAYLEQLKSEYEVMLLSGLPELYAKSRIGFRTARGSEEALAKLLSKLGRNAKLNVITRSSESRVSGS